MNPTLADIAAALSSGNEKGTGDKHTYGQVKSVVRNAQGKVTGYNVSLGGASGTTHCRKLAGAKVGDTVMVTIMGGTNVAVVTGTINGDADAEDALNTATDAKEGLIDLSGEVDGINERIEDGEFTVDFVQIEYCLASANEIPPGGSFEDIQETDWDTVPPEDLDGMYVWIRTATVMEDGEIKYSDPAFNAAIQAAIEEDPFEFKIVAKESVQYCLATASYLNDGQEFDDIIAPGESWSSTMPEYNMDNLLYIWARNIYYFTDGTVEEGTPYFDSRAQVAAEALCLEESTGNYFWSDTTGAYITKTPQNQYKQNPTGYAQRIVAEGILSLYNGHKLVTKTSTGITYWDPNMSADPGNEISLVTYGASGTVFNDNYEFKVGGTNRYIKWVTENGVKKIKIAADEITLGGSGIETGGRWYSGTAITGTSTTPTVFSGSGITNAVVGDMYLNTSTSNTYRCTLAGGPSTAKWAYVNNIKGAQGNPGVDVTSSYVSYNSSTGLFVHHNSQTTPTASNAYGVQINGSAITMRYAGAAKMIIGTSNIDFSQADSGAFLQINTNDGLSGGYNGGSVSGGDGEGGLDFSNRVDSTQRAVLYDNKLIHLQCPNVYTGYVKDNIWHENVRFYNSRSSDPLLKCYGDFSVDGSKSRMVKTESYSDRLLYCYETPTPMFGDIGEGIIGEDGAAYIFVDPIFAQAIEGDQYQVFIQKYGAGDIAVDERTPSYFKVTGTPALEFGWEIKAKQKGYSQRRLETESFDDWSGNETDYSMNAARYIRDLFEERRTA